MKLDVQQADLLRLACSHRTRAYQELLISYLQWCKDAGFAYAHIWACPPLPGDDYIFWAHPEEQKVPQQKRLRDWYRTMLGIAKVCMPGHAG